MKTRLAGLIAAILIAFAWTAAMGEVPQAATSSASAAHAPMTTPVAPPAISREVVNNPYSLDALWRDGDLVARGTLIILLIMSMGTWYIMITKLVDHFRMMGQAAAARNSTKARRTNRTNNRRIAAGMTSPFNSNF